MELFDLEKQFAFYGAYHKNPINIIIHMIFVWPILFTTLMLFYYLPMIILPNMAVFFTVIYGMFYVGFDKKAGLLGAFLCALSYFGASSIAFRLGFDLTWKVVLVAQVICWAAQFFGHGVFEKRAPALFDNLAQAFLMAPFFVLLEALQHFLGYEPYPGFHAKVKVLIDENIKEWQEKKRKKSS